MAFSDPMFKNKELQDKVIVVTGGGSGLGKSMSQYFLTLGAKVVITSRNFDKLSKTQNELIKHTGGEVLPVACDVRNFEEVENMLSKTLDKFGKVDCLFNNAA